MHYHAEAPAKGRWWRPVAVAQNRPPDRLVVLSALRFLDEIQLIVVEDASQKVGKWQTYSKRYQSYTRDPTCMKKMESNAGETGTPHRR
jgi:hypothetical protein